MRPGRTSDILITSFYSFILISAKGLAKTEFFRSNLHINITIKSAKVRIRF